MSARTPPEYVHSVLRALEAKGYEAQLVGGCVRDFILGRRPKDWDICTNARPEAVMSIFPRSYPTGIKHGTVTVASGGRMLEVTTYRTDGDYADFRRPDSVSFVSDLESDLARRDFTMNACAVNLAGELFDPFGGKDDIGAKLIRCVGEPEKRFGEDALRMLRALRFSAVLGFDIEEATRRAIEENAGLIRHVAIERVSSELNKALLSDRPEAVAHMLETGVFFRKTALSQDLRLRRIKRLNKSLAQRWAALCAIMLSLDVISDAEAFLRSLRQSSETIKCASRGANLALSMSSYEILDWKRLLSAKGRDVGACAYAAIAALNGFSWAGAYRELLKSGECYSADMLAIGGDELSSLGFKGKALGSALKSLLEHVFINPEDNNHDTLLRLAKVLPRS